MSQRVNISKVIHVNIIDNSSNPVVWRGVGESEERLHAIEPAHNIKTVVPSELLNLTVCETLISSHLGVGSLGSAMVMFRFVMVFLLGILRWGEFFTLRHF